MTAVSGSASWPGSRSGTPSSTTKHRGLLSRLAFSRDEVAEYLGALVAIVLIGADVALTLLGRSDSGLAASVPVIVAFYFGGRVSNQGARSVTNGKERS